VERPGTRPLIAKVPRGITKEVTGPVTTVRSQDIFPGIVPRKKSPDRMMVGTRMTAGTRVTAMPSQPINHMAATMTAPVTTVRSQVTSPGTVLKSGNPDTVTMRAVIAMMGTRVTGTRMKAGTETTGTPNQLTSHREATMTAPVTTVRSRVTSPGTVLKNANPDMATMRAVIAMTGTKRTTTEENPSAKAASNAANKDTFPRNAARRFSASSARRQATSRMSAKPTNF